VGFPQVADRGRLVWRSIESGEALFALGRRGRLVAVTSLNAHQRLLQLADWLRPDTTYDDVRLVE
jgi:hypothetical protein